jgi:uncharacterized protein YecE (DUF72 family)
MAKASAPLELPSTCPPAVEGIRVGIGGWTFAPWRDNFYPKGLVQRRELEYASRHVSAIEINGTWYGAQKPATYAKWRDETPEGFVFSAKAPMRITMARTLANTGAQVDAFLGDILTLGDKLGPIVWQFDPERKLAREDFAEFLSLLPHEIDGHRIRHVLDVRVAAFIDRAFLELARGHGMATVFTDSTEHPSFADVTGDFVYARLMRTRSDVPTGYPPDELRQWARRARTWADGGRPDDLPYVDADAADAGRPRDVFLYFISSAKERNPAAAMALLRELGAVTDS